MENVPAVLAAVKSFYAGDNPIIDTTDGLSLEFGEWRMNIRASNTEPLLRLNIESRDDAPMIGRRLAEIEALIAANA